MSEVDPYDDGLDRWLVLEFRYDPERRENRHVIMAAFNSERERNQRLTDLQVAMPDASLTLGHHPVDYTADQQTRRDEWNRRGFKTVRQRKRRR